MSSDEHSAHPDRFAALWGAERGRAGARALASNPDSAPARREEQRLCALIAAGHPQEALDALGRTLDERGTLRLTGAHTRIADCLVRDTVARCYADAQVRERTARALWLMHLRTEYAEHAIWHVRPGQSAGFHLSASVERHQPSQSPTETICGLVIPTTEVIHANRGDWARADPHPDWAKPEAPCYRVVRCPRCAAQAERFEECSEPSDYPPLSGDWERKVLAGARRKLKACLPRALDDPGQLQRLALDSYRATLRNLAAAELHACGEWPYYSAILDSERYRRLGELASEALREAKLAGALSLSDWRAVLGQLLAQVLPAQGPANMDADLAQMLYARAALRLRERKALIVKALAPTA